MNETKIEWTDYTWNPVSGCKHSCRNTYCYNTMKRTSVLNRYGATYIDNKGQKRREKKWRTRETGENHVAKKGEIYPNGYDPTFYPIRLREPLSQRTPSKIFVVDVGDLFGAWVPKDWIEQVTGIVRMCPHHTFQFLTKNPKRYLEFEFPSNSWVGTTVTSDKDVKRVEIIRNVQAPVRFLSIEPLLGEVTCDFSSLQWLILGAETGKNPFIPSEQWISRIIEQAKDLRIPLFMKDNIKDYSRKFVREFPIT
jgi:protein gp37